MIDAERWTSFRRGGFRWRASADCPAGLADLVLRLRAGETGAAVAVKSNAVRTVLRLDVEGEGFYVKLHRFRGMADAAKALLRGTRAEREWRMERAASQCGARCPSAVLVGVRQWRGLPVEAVLATREAPGALLQHLASDFVLPASGGQARLRHAIARSLGDMVARLHSGGFYHPDLHQGNLLVRESDGELCLLDLHSASAGRLTAARRAQNLGMLHNMAASLRATPTDRMRFGRAYLGQAWTPESARALEGEAAASGKRLAQRHLRSRSRRCVVKSTLYTNERSKMGRTFRLRAWPLEQAAEAVRRHKAVLAGQMEGRTLLDEPRKRSTLFAWDGPPDAQRLVVEEFVSAGLRRLLPATLRHRRAMRAWRASLGLKVRGVAAPEALALVAGRGRSAWVVMREPLGIPLGDEASQRKGPAQRRAFLAATAKFVAHLFRTGVRHGALDARSILVREAQRGEWEFCLTRLESVAFAETVPHNERIETMARLHATAPACLTRTDRLRFHKEIAAEWPDMASREAIRTIVRSAAPLARQ